MTPAPAPRRFVALGDSYTIGEGVAAEERWPVQLVARLRRDRIEVAEPQIVAQTGWTTDELWDGMDRANPAGDCALVSLLVGVNDQYRGRSLEDFRRGLLRLLKRATSLATNDPARVMVLSIPDWGVTPFAAGRDRAAIARQIEAYNAVNREETEARGAHYVDTSAASRAAGSDAGLLVSDGLHPSGRLYAVWAERALPTARAILATT